MAPERDDEREVMARTAGAMWLFAAVVTLAAQALPGAERDHLPVLLALMIPVGLHGGTCLAGKPWTRVSINVHGLGGMVMFPLVGVGVWATGGARSYLIPLLLMAVLFCGYFFPPRWSWPLTAELVVSASIPILFLDDGGSLQANAIALAFTLAAAAAAANQATATLKRRLVVAEARQRDMAHRDPLTGVANRRAFDAALAHAAGARRTFSLLVLDLDDFKGINDSYGHPVGDRVLVDIAARCAEVIRADDCLARIGGDEFAVVAPGAGHVGAVRLAHALEEAVARVRRGGSDATMRATVTVATHPDDGPTVEDLMRVADGALHARKRARRPVARSVQAPA